MSTTHNDSPEVLLPLAAAGDELFPAAALELALELDVPPVIDLTDPLLLDALSPEQHTDRYPTPRGVWVSIFKPLVERSAAVVALVLLSPILLVLAAMVRLTLGRGVLFEQRRIGLGGRPFTILKFRTMKHSRRQHDEPVPVERRRTHKHPNDPRLTRTGRFMRTWSLDELPQLVNIARGEMSIIGPRPELETIVARYEPWQHQRHVVRPGLTGLWQVSDRASGKLLCECTEIDIEYVETVSFRTDLRILVRTPSAALGSNRGI